MKKVMCCFVALALFACHANASLIITGLIDGDLPGGNPKAVILTATADIADLSLYGAGSANNGGGSDGVELQFSGSASTGDVILITNSADSTAFFTDCYTDDFITFEGAPAFINGDDAVEVFDNVMDDMMGGLTGDLLDVYGDPDTNGDGETWDYTDGYAVRIGGSAGAFDQMNYSSNAFVLDGLDEDQHKDTFAQVFGFTPVPEPSPAFLTLTALAALALTGRRR